MNPIIPTLILSTLLLSCQNATKNVRNAKQEDIRRTAIALNKKMRVQIDEVANHSGYLLRICKGMKQINMDTIETKYRKQDLDFADWNFDGYLDLYVLDNSMSGVGGMVHQVWLYAPSERQFKNWGAVSGRMGTSLDTKNKKILISYREGANCLTKDVYSVKENKLVYKKGMQETSWTDSKGRDWVKIEHVRIVQNKPVYFVDSFARK